MGVLVEDKKKELEDFLDVSVEEANKGLDGSRIVSANYRENGQAQYAGTVEVRLRLNPGKFLNKKDRDEVYSELKSLVQKTCGLEVSDELDYAVIGLPRSQEREAAIKNGLGKIRELVRLHSNALELYDMFLLKEHDSRLGLVVRNIKYHQQG